MSEIGTPGFCRDCPYWVAHDQHESKGTCRRYPPTAGVGAPKILPTTSRLDWCGEHPERKAVTAQQDNPREQADRGQAIRPAPAKRRRAA